MTGPLDLDAFAAALPPLPDAPRPQVASTNGAASAPYGQAALEDELAKLRAAPEGDRNRQLFRSARNLAELVAGGHLSQAPTRAVLEAVAHEIGLDVGEIGPTIASGFRGDVTPRIPAPRLPKPLPGPAKAPAPKPVAQVEEPPEDTPPSRLRVLSLGDLAEINAADHVIDTLLPHGLTVVYGPPGTLKSFMVLSMGLHASSDVDWCGFRVQGCPTWYLAGEGAGGLRPRVAGWRQVHADLEPGPFWITPHAVNLLDAAMVAEVVGVVRTLGIGLVIVDTMARCLVGGEENSARDVGMFIDALARVIEAGAAVLVVHHTGKDGSSERGSSALRGAADSMIEITRSGDLVTVRQDKAKDTDEAPAFLLERVVVKVDGMARPDGSPVTTCVVVDGSHRGGGLSDAAMTCLRALAEADLGDGITKSVWLAVSPVAPRTVHRAAKELMEAGLVTRIGDTRNAPFTPTEQGREAIGEG